MKLWAIKRLQQHADRADIAENDLVFTSIEKSLQYIYTWYIYNLYRGSHNVGLKPIVWEWYSDSHDLLVGYRVLEGLSGIIEKQALWQITPVAIDNSLCGVCTISETLEYGQGKEYPSQEELFSFSETTTYIPWQSQAANS